MNSEPASPKYTVLLPSRWGWFVGLKADPFQTGSIMTQGEWAPNEFVLLRSFLRRGDTVIDAGANVGNFTLAFAAAVGDTGHVLAFEPQRFCFTCLSANIALNSLMHFVSAFNVALGDSQGTIEVPVLDPTIAMCNFGGVSLIDKHTTPTETCPLLTVDSFGMTSLRLLKVDVEGMEPAVLRGAKETIRELRPVIWCESLRHERADNEPELKAFFQENGYRAWKVCTGLFDPNNSRISHHNMFALGDNGDTMQDHNMLALPNEAPVPDWLNAAEVEVMVK